MPRPVVLPFQRADLPPDLGDRLRSLRVDRRLSRREVAYSAGIAPRTLARIERNAQRPTWKTLDTLCAILGIWTSTIAPRWTSDDVDRTEDPSAVPGLGLRALRIKMGVTLTDLAVRSGVSAATISRFERGLVASRSLTTRKDEPGVPMGERMLILDNTLIAEVLGFSDPAAFRQACIDTYHAG